MYKDHNRYRNTSITFRLTEEERDAVHFRAKMLGIPLQKMFLKTFNNQTIEITLGMFDSERIAIEIRKLRKTIENLTPGDESTKAVISNCRNCIKQLEIVLKSIKEGDTN